MDRDREKAAIHAQLALCRELAAEFPGGLTLQQLRVLESGLVDELGDLEQSTFDDLTTGRRGRQVLPQDE